jgi:hypothetical protein
MKFLIPSVAITGLFLTSCATSESFVNDDVYSVKPSELPLGESTADETSYASFKTRKQGDVNDRMTYADEMALRNRQNCLEQYRWYEGCGCSYSEWLRSSRYSHQNNFNRGMRWGSPSFGMSYAYGAPYSYYNGFYPYNSFGGHHPYVGYWGYNSMYMSPYHNSPYMWNDSYFGYGMGMGFGYPFYGNMGGYPYGYYNPIGRAAANPAQVLMIQNNASRTTPTSTRSNTVVKEVGNRDITSRPASPTTNRTENTGRTVAPGAIRNDVNRGTTYENRPSGGQRVTTPTNSSGNSDYQRSYPSRDNSTPNSRGTTGVSSSRTSSPSNGGFERSSTPTQSRGTSISSSPSRGSSGSGVSSSPSGGSRSGSSSGSNSGGGRR